MAPSRPAPLLLAVGIVLFAGESSAQHTRLLDRSPAGVPANGSCTAASISGDGEFVVFDSIDETLVPVTDPPNCNIFVVERSTGIVTLESVSTAGVEADDHCSDPVISADGRFVLFISNATTLVPGEAPASDQVYLRDRAAGTTRRVSLAADGGFVDAPCTETAMSGDGSFVCFTTAAKNIVSGMPGATNPHIYGFDVASGTTELLTRASDGSLLEFGGSDPSIDRSGQFVAFASISRNHSDRDQLTDLDVLLRDRAAGTTEWISDPGSNPRAHGQSGEPAISADGRFVAFSSDNNAILPDEPDRTIVYLRDRALGITTDETPDIEDYGESWVAAVAPTVSADGRFVTYSTSATFDPRDWGDETDVYVRDRLLGRFELASIGDAGEVGTHHSQHGTISDDGRMVAFLSLAAEFAPDDGGVDDNVFIREWPRDRASWTSYGTGFPGRDGAIPTLAAADDPHLGLPLSLDISNSSAAWTFGFLYAGFDAIDVKTSFGGHLLVAPIATLPVPLTPTGWRETTDLDLDWSLSGLVVRAQVLELDPYAAKGVSFTNGLELVLGY